ncbi:MAG: hypothetical protein AAFX52_13820 [Pseudomonadota bacterium]
MLISAAFLLSQAIAADPSADVSCDQQIAGDVAMYPTAAELPANLLRIYLYFPFDVRAQDVLRHIKLVESSGEDVEGAFLPNRFDLLSPDRRRVTLLMDPGRVKTGLIAHEELGRALKVGEDYRLVVNHTSIGLLECSEEPASFQFTVANNDTVPPLPDDWGVKAPTAGTRDPLVVEFGSPHDHLSLAYRIRVQTTDGTNVPGNIALGTEEKSWIFTPAKRWQSTDFVISIDDQLEDLAGNRPTRLFDQPVGTPPRTWKNKIYWRPTEAPT